jgi:hypothetical protein
VTVVDTGVIGQFEMRVSATGVPGYERPDPVNWPVKASVPTLVEQYLKAFAEEGISAAQRQSRLVGAGKDFWNLVPRTFQDLYWELAGQGRELGSVLVVTQEPSFPWELVVPHRRRPDGTDEQHHPLGVTAPVGRHIRDDLTTPEQDLHLNASWVLAPVYTGTLELKQSAAEATFVCDRFRGERIDPSDFDAIVTAFVDRPVPLFHMICHGSSEAGIAQAVKLDGGVDLLSIDVGGNDGLRQAFQTRDPLVFVNACEGPAGRRTSSASEASRSRSSGWARAASSRRCGTSRTTSPTRSPRPSTRRSPLRRRRPRR